MYWAASRGTGLQQGCAALRQDCNISLHEARTWCMQAAQGMKQAQLSGFLLCQSCPFLSRFGPHPCGRKKSMTSFTALNVYLDRARHLVSSCSRILSSAMTSYLLSMRLKPFCSSGHDVMISAVELQWWKSFCQLRPDVICCEHSSTNFSSGSLVKSIRVMKILYRP